MSEEQQQDQGTLFEETVQFSFAEAVNHLKDGRAVTRTEWWKEDKSLIKDEGFITLRRPTLPGFSSRRNSPWIPSVADFVANDWVLAPLAPVEHQQEPVA